MEHRFRVLQWTNKRKTNMQTKNHVLPASNLLQGCEENHETPYIFHLQGKMKIGHPIMGPRRSVQAMQPRKPTSKESNS
jgi:hypothetical protein